jgi:hypothetical protein
MVCHVSGARKAEVFENREPRKIFGPKRDKVRRDCRRVHNEYFYDLLSSPNIVGVNKSGRMRWAGYVARMGRGEVRTGKPREGTTWKTWT